MTEQRRDLIKLVAVVHDDALLVEVGDTGPRLPRATGNDGSFSADQAIELAGSTDAFIAAPHRLVEAAADSPTDDPNLTVELVCADRRPDLDPGFSWLPVSELSALDEPTGVADAIRTGVDEWTGRIPRPELRPAWYRRDWYSDVDSWIDARLEHLGRHRTGPSKPVKVWSLSAVLEIPVDGTTGTGSSVFFKSPCDHFRSEPALTQALRRISPKHLPDVLAVDHDRAWMLMAAIPGATENTPAEHSVAAARAHAQLQIDLIPHLPMLRAGGVPDRTLAPTLDGLAQIISDSVELDQLSPADRSQLDEMHPWLVEQLVTFADSSLPYSIAHGDLHKGNVAVAGDSLVIYDWTDASVSFPFVDLIVLAASAGDQLKADVHHAYAKPWAGGFDRADVDQMIERIPLINQVFEAISYEGIYRSREPDSLWEMRGIVALRLQELLAVWRGRAATA